MRDSKLWNFHHQKAKSFSLIKVRGILFQDGCLSLGILGISLPLSLVWCYCWIKWGLCKTSMMILFVDSDFVLLMQISLLLMWNSCRSELNIWLLMFICYVIILINKTWIIYVVCVRLVFFDVSIITYSSISILDLYLTKNQIKLRSRSNFDGKT